jgi:hypothetical protein
MWDLDDQTLYFRFLAVSVDFAYAFGDSDRDKREHIRQAVAPHWPPHHRPNAAWWAFRIYSQKSGFDWEVEDLPKLIIDAFSRQQIEKDKSSYPQLWLYFDDKPNQVRMVQVMADRTFFREFTMIEIFGAIPSLDITGPTTK